MTAKCEMLKRTASLSPYNLKQKYHPNTMTFSGSVTLNAHTELLTRTFMTSTQMQQLEISHSFFLMELSSRRKKTQIKSNASCLT